MKIINIVLNDFTNDSRVLKTSKSLINMGFDVKVIAMHSHNLKINETVEGVQVDRIHLVSRQWPKNSLIQILKFIEFIYKVVTRYRDVQIMHCNDLNGLLVGVICKITKPKLLLIYDSHEFAINDKPHQHKISIFFHYILEKILIKFPKHVINVSESIANEYERIYKIKKPFLILNCPNYRKQEKRNIFRNTFEIEEDKKIFLYQGALSIGRGIEILLKAFAESPSQDSVIVFMGYGSLQQLVENYATKYKNIFFHPAVSYNVLLDYTSSADYGISFGEDCCLSYRYSLPNKMFEYVMAGIPVLTSNLVEMRRFVENEGVGISAENNTIEGFRCAISEILKINYKNLSINVLEAQKKYCWEVQEDVLRKVYRDL